MESKAGQDSAKLVHTIYNQIPAFTDVFDEDTFYLFAAFVVCTTIVVVCTVSRFITIKAVD